MKRLLSQLFYCPDICSLKTYTKNENTRPSGMGRDVDVDGNGNDDEEESGITS